MFFVFSLFFLSFVFQFFFFFHLRFLVLLLFHVVRADAKPRKKSSGSSYCKKTMSFCENSILGASVGREKGVKSDPFVSDFAFIIFSFLFVFLGAENLFLGGLTSSNNISFQKINFLSRLGGVSL